ncbi:hypothetical protein GCM10010321_61720 [Streptomyces chartreusis]|nr:hypothetical protein GCM10010321_61720 [Streptomyces chartreusis]
MDAQEDLRRLPGQRLDDVDVAVRDAGLRGLLYGGLRDLLHQVQHLLLGLLLLLLALERLALDLLLPVALRLAELLEQVLERLLPAELLELLEGAAHAVRLLLAVALLLPEGLLVRRRARVLLALLLSHVTHLRGGAHTGVTFP